MLMVVILVNPLEGTLKSSDAMNVIGSAAKPNRRNITVARPSSAGEDHPSSRNTPIVATIIRAVEKNVR